MAESRFIRYRSGVESHECRDDPSFYGDVSRNYRGDKIWRLELSEDSIEIAFCPYCGAPLPKGLTGYDFEEEPKPERPKPIRRRQGG